MWRRRDQHALRSFGHPLMVSRELVGFLNGAHFDASRAWDNRAAVAVCVSDVTPEPERFSVTCTANYLACAAKWGRERGRLAIQSASFNRRANAGCALQIISSR
jgi:hypothetical protein